jgi:hypothetical protein
MADSLCKVEALFIVIFIFVLIVFHVPLHHRRLRRSVDRFLRNFLLRPRRAAGR